VLTQPELRPLKGHHFVQPLLKFHLFTMSDQRGAIKAYALAGKTPTEAYDLIKAAYGDLAFSRRHTFNLHKQFKSGRVSIESQAGKSPKPTLRTEDNVAMIRNMVESDRRVTIQELVSGSGLSTGTIHLILHEDLSLSKVSARWVPRLLSDDHKRQHLEMARTFKRLHFQQGEAFLRSIVTMDESWVLYATPETKQQSMQWVAKGSNPPVKAKVVGSQKKIMLVAFFDVDGMVYQHYVPQGTTINSEYYCEVLRTFLRHLRDKRPEKIQNGWLLHQDNARPHTSKFTSEFMESKGIKTLYHAPYSPDLAPCDFFLFPKLKKAMAGRRFDTKTELKVAVQGVLTDLSKEGFLHVFEKWAERLEKCTILRGSYVEKEN